MDEIESFVFTYVRSRNIRFNEYRSDARLKLLCYFLLRNIRQSGKDIVRVLIEPSFTGGKTFIEKFKTKDNF